MSEQVIIKLKNIDQEKEINLFHNTRKTVLDTLQEKEFLLPGLCNGAGLCGKCVVRFCGYAPLPTQKDRAVIDSDQLRKGYRLACTARPTKDCAVETAFHTDDYIDIISDSLIDFTKQGNYAENADSVHTMVPVDLGTTAIAMQLFDSASGKVWDTYTCMNPQRGFGIDVLSRIKAANEGKANLLRRMIHEALTAGLEHLMGFGKEHELKEPDLIVIACNTTMAHLFMGYSTENLGKSPFSPVSIETEDMEWNGVRTIILPGISAFVGGDIVAGLYTCDLYHRNIEKKGIVSPRTWMFLDLGTNAEMTIGNEEGFMCTAAAAGSAFEGNDSKNIKGTEKISLISHLLKSGIINETGLLQEPFFETGISKDHIFITQEDIRNIQMAKAAIRAGIYFLRENFGVSKYESIDRLYIAGGFGFYLDKDAAVQIGLIPQELRERIEVVGNTSLIGARLFGQFFMKNENEIMNVKEIVKSSKTYNLAEQKDFEKNYINNIKFSI